MAFIDARFRKAQLMSAPDILKAEGIATTPSGAAGLAGLIKAGGDAELRRSMDLDERSCVLLFVTEGGR